ncbi:MAG: hypothetical protein ACRYF3_05915 [Janthinobacterium lividum]
MRESGNLAGIRDTQRLEEGRLRRLDSHLSYPLALRTFSAAESRAVFGTSDAFELPPAPGSAYLKVDTTVYQRLHVVIFQAAGGITSAGGQPVLRRLRELGSQGLLLSGPGEEGAVLHGTRLRSLPAGRAVHTARRGTPRLVQIAFTEEDDET